LAGTASAQTITYTSFYAKVGSGLQSGIQFARLSDAQHGGITIHIESADTTLAFVSADAQTPGTEFVDIFIPNGTIQAGFFTQMVEDTIGMVSITASAPGFGSVTDSTEIVQPAMRLFSLQASTDVSAVDDAFQVQIGIPTSTNSNLQQFQAARAGGPGLTVTVSHTNPVAAQLVTTALTAQVVTVIVLPGQNASPSAVSIGGVALDGIGTGGVTEVTAAIPGFIATAADTQTVTTTQSIIAFTGTPFEVGSGLQTPQKRVILSGAQHGGVTVHVESSDSNLALLAPNATTPGEPSIDLVIANGITQTNLYISAPADTFGMATITASVPDFISGVENVDIVTPAFELVGLASSIDIFDPPDLTLVYIGVPRLDFSSLQTYQVIRPGGVPLSVQVASSDSFVGNFVLEDDTLGIVTLPIGVGENRTPSALIFGGTAFDGIALGTTQVKASIPGFVSTAAGSLDVTVTEPTMALVNMPDFGVGSGLRSGLARAELGATAHGGVNIRIKSTEPAVILVAVHADSTSYDSVDVFVPDGQFQAQFYMHALEDTIGSTTIMASAPGFSGISSPVDNVAPAVRIHSDLGNTLDTIDPPDNFRIQVGVPINSNTNVQSQNVRIGGQPILVTLALDDSLLATFHTLADSSDTVTTVVDIGNSFCPASAASGGVALDGLAPGSVAIAASAPGFVDVTDAHKVVTITAPTISVSGLNSDIGSGLQSGPLTAMLSASNHGGVTLHVETSDTNVVLVSSGETTAGTEFVDIFVPDGTDNPTFYVQGVDNTTGNPTVSVSAPQFVSTDIFPVVVQPAVDINNLAAAIDVGDPTDDFHVRAGVPSLGNTFVQYPQLRRGGALPLAVTVVSNDTSAAHVVTNLLQGDTVFVEIVAGESQSPDDVASDGVGLLPIAEGQTIVFASIPGFIQTGGAQKTVDITNTSIVYLGLPSRLGAGLETNVVTAQLGSSGHGGVTVHVEVDDTTKALVSLNSLVVGGESVDIAVINGQTDAPFYLQAFDGASDTVFVTASAPGFVTNVKPVEIVSPALQITSLADSFTTASADDEFVVQIGALRADSTGILETQLVRAGGTPVDIKVSSSDSSVATLETMATSADSAVVTIGIGEGETPLTVLTGGMALNPASAGNTLIEATALGFYTTEAGSSTVYVTSSATGIFDGKVPSKLALGQNYPNPFNPTTTIDFVLPATMHTELAIFDVRGRRVVTLLNRSMSDGVASVTWDGRDQNGVPVSSGIYFYRLVAGTTVQTRKMVLLK